MSLFRKKTTIGDIVRKDEKKKKKQAKQSKKELTQNMTEYFKKVKYWPGDKAGFEEYLGHKLDYIKIADVYKINICVYPSGQFTCYESGSDIGSNALGHKLYDEKIIGLVYAHSRGGIPVKRAEETIEVIKGDIQ
ncbi:MAG: hypothetical protein ABIC91_07525 [Nanoarchaeota archaeon]|nr:hypothetical protein [Nanoarchaeota archaeon]MBU1029759.1 hypothetical protein [Nanoarchaeota archaeon]MBU1850766.1 hypothetical protein [Nanoarchaeota archaeon]